MRFCWRTSVVAVAGRSRKRNCSAPPLRIIFPIDSGTKEKRLQMAEDWGQSHRGCARPRAQRAPGGRTRPVSSKFRHLPTLLRPGTGALRQGHCRPRAVCFSVLSARARNVRGFDATAFGVDDLLTRLPRVEPSRGRGATVRPWAGLRNPFRIEGAGAPNSLVAAARRGLEWPRRVVTEVTGLVDLYRVE